VILAIAYVAAILKASYVSIIEINVLTTCPKQRLSSFLEYATAMSVPVCCHFPWENGVVLLHCCDAIAIDTVVVVIPV
jgi:hypothetical protein